LRRAVSFARCADVRNGSGWTAGFVLTCQPAVYQSGPPLSSPYRACELRNRKAASHRPEAAFCLYEILSVSFQITILKVLAGQPEGHATQAELTRQVAILMSSGSDWTDRTKRLAALAPGLSIFGSRFITHDSGCWQITDAGRAFLLSLESPAPQIPEDVPTATPPEAQLVPMLTEPMPSEQPRTTERPAARGRSSSTLMRLISNMRRRTRHTVAEGKRQAS
jgi:hypothetical protein